MPILSLEEFRTILGWNPWHFYGLSNSAKAPIQSSCNRTLPEYSWQSQDALGRNDIRTALETAEAILAKHLGYWPGPHYEEETLAWNAYHDSSSRRYGATEADGRRVSTRTRYGKILSIGAEVRTTVGTYPVTINTQDEDTSLDDTFLMRFQTSETDPSVFTLEFADNDRAAGVYRDYTVRPVSVSIASGWATVKGPTWLIVKPSLYEGIHYSPSGAQTLDPDNRDTFVKSLKVVKLTYESGITEDTASTVLRWESRPCGTGWWCCGSLSNEAGTDYYAIGRTGIRNAETGTVLPDMAMWDGSAWKVNQSWCCGAVEPDSVVLRYVSGVAPVSGRMPVMYAQMVARLAMGEMARRVCACSEANREFERWQYEAAADETYRLSDSNLNSPLGTSLGAIWAWNKVKALRLRRGVSV